MSAGDAKTEMQRRRRVVKGWAFQNLHPDAVAAIRAYLAGEGPVPAGYEQLDRIVR